MVMLVKWLHPKIVKMHADEAVIVAMRKRSYMSTHTNYCTCGGAYNKTIADKAYARILRGSRDKWVTLCRVSFTCSTCGMRGEMWQMLKESDFQGGLTDGT